MSVLVPLNSKDEGADCTLLCLPLSAAELAQWHWQETIPVVDLLQSIESHNGLLHVVFMSYSNYVLHGSVPEQLPSAAVVCTSSTNV